MGKIKKLGLGVLGLGVFGIGIVALSGGEEDSTPTSTSNTATEVVDTETNQSVEVVEEAPALFAIGQTARVGDLEVTVNSVSTSTYVGNELLGQAPQGVYLIVNTTVKNVASEQSSFTDSMFKVIDDGFEYSPDLGVMFYDGDSLGFETLNPNLSATGNVYFDVPEEVANGTEKFLRATVGFFSTEEVDLSLTK